MRLAALLISLVFFHLASLPAIAGGPVDRDAAAAETSVRVTEMAAERVLYAIDQGLNAAALAVATTTNRWVIQDELRRIADRLPGVRAVLGIDLKGQLIYDSYTYPPAPLDLSDRQYFRDARDGVELVIGETVIGRSSGTSFVPVARRVGGLVWVAVASPYALVDINTGCLDCISALIRPDGRVITMFPETRLPTGFLDPALGGRGSAGSQVMMLNKVAAVLAWRRNGDFPVISVAIRGTPEAAAVDIDTQ